MDAAAQAFEQGVLPLFERKSSEWVEDAREAAKKLGAGGKVVTIDDVRGVCPPPADTDPRVMGAVFSKREWECLGYRKSNRTACHGRPVAIWRLKP